MQTSAGGRDDLQLSSLMAPRKTSREGQGMLRMCCSISCSLGMSDASCMCPSLQAGEACGGNALMLLQLVVKGTCRKQRS